MPQRTTAIAYVLLVQKIRLCVAGTYIRKIRDKRATDVFFFATAVKPPDSQCEWSMKIYNSSSDYMIYIYLNN